MTSEIVYEQYIQAGSKKGGSHKPNKGFMQTTSNFLGLGKKSADRKSASNVKSLLQTAYKKLQEAEHELAQKEKRIRELESILTIDELTGVTNRRGFYNRFEAELDRTNRGENDGGLLIMIDLDYFKAINDTFGHLAGDEALKCVARFLNAAVRPMDVVARMGGDEFIILMPNTSIPKAMARAKNLGNELNSLTFSWNDSTVHINGSLGLKEYARGNTIQGIIQQADAGMYANKKDRKKALIN
ncbi:MAG: GGDEF domain-containing protein [Alcanivorax sp.]